VTHLATEDPPYAFDEARAARLRPVLSTILTRLAATLPSLKVQ
jgi:formiminoglutamase